MRCCVMRPKKRSTWLRHEAEVGVKWRWKRGWVGPAIGSRLEERSLRRLRRETSCQKTPSRFLER